ncbi:MAG: hypothetical protein V1859_02220 [archaeon]
MKPKYNAFAIIIFILAIFFVSCINKENASDTKELSNENIPEERSLVIEIKNQIQGKDGKTYDVYPSSEYDYSVSDAVFKGYNMEKLSNKKKQCHIRSERKHMATHETQPFWRPLKIPCENKDDCINYIRKNDSYLSYLLQDDTDILCIPYAI